MKEEVKTTNHSMVSMQKTSSFSFFVCDVNQCQSRWYPRLFQRYLICSSDVFSCFLWLWFPSWYLCYLFGCLFPSCLSSMRIGFLLLPCQVSLVNPPVMSFCLVISYVNPYHYLVVEVMSFLTDSLRCWSCHHCQICLSCIVSVIIILVIIIMLSHLFSFFLVPQHSHSMLVNYVFPPIVIQIVL
jgi:hypothetical protein